MKTYKRETKKILGCFLQHQITCNECLDVLDEALDRLISRGPREEFSTLCTLMLANKEIVMKEVARRASTV